LKEKSGNNAVAVRTIKRDKHKTVKCKMIFVSDMKIMHKKFVYNSCHTLISNNKKNYVSFSYKVMAVFSLQEKFI
jgi:hypothetical protein